MTRLRNTILLLFISMLAPAAFSQATGTIDFNTSLTHIDGFGGAVALSRAAVIHGLFGLGPTNQNQIIELLFSPSRGIGLSIVRTSVGSSTPDKPYDAAHTIEPVSPGSPDNPPNYVWDNNDDGQVWVTQQ